MLVGAKAIAKADILINKQSTLVDICGLDNCFDDLRLSQLVNFPTWSRLVNGSLRSSVLDHLSLWEVYN